VAEKFEDNIKGIFCCLQRNAATGFSFFLFSQDKKIIIIGGRCLMDTRSEEFVLYRVI